MDALFLLDLLGLAVCLPAAAAVAAASRSTGRRPFLSAVFAEAGAFFLADLLARAGTAPAVSLSLNFGVLFLVMPSLYLFERETQGDPEPRWFRHYLPFLMNAPVGIALALAYVGNGFRGSYLLMAYMAAALSGQTIQLAAYGRAGLRRALGMAAKAGTEWPRRAARAVIAGSGVVLAFSWLQYLYAAAEEILDRPLPRPEGWDIPPLLAAALLAWTLGLCVLWGKDAEGLRETRKYGGRPLPESEGRDLLTRVRAAVEAEPDLGSHRLEPRRIAARLGVPYYLLSRAVNEGAGVTLGGLVNEYRVARARDLLSRKPSMSVLEVALESGFEAKSTFNEVFRRSTGMSPREYRRSGSGAGGSDSDPVPDPGKK